MRWATVQKWTSPWQLQWNFNVSITLVRELDNPPNMEDGDETGDVADTVIEEMSCALTIEGNNW